VPARGLSIHPRKKERERELNNRGVVAYFFRELGGGQGIFVEQTGGVSPAAVIDPLSVPGV